MSFSHSPLQLSFRLLLGTAGITLSAVAMAQSGGSSQLQVIQVTALSIDESAAKIVAPFNLLDQSQIFNRGGSLGDLLNGLPGVHSDSFGGGASRPVVRGQTSPRVRVLSDSATLFDASDISPDHAVVADPLLAQRIEVLRGPATLLYGGGAIGGVVNVLDNKIATQVPDQTLQGSLALRGNSVADERAGALNATALLGSNLVLHVEGSRRETDNYEAEGWNESRVDNTFSDSDNAALGLSWVGDKGYLGMAYSYRNDNYGIPGHSHEYESCHPHSAALHCGSHDAAEEHDHDHDHEEEAGPWIGLDSTRTDLRGELREPLPGIHRVRVRASHTDYSHDEIEEGTAITNYDNRSWESRIEVDHAELFGWHGVVGTQFSDTRFESAGAEAYLPATDSSMQSLFAVEHYDFNDEWHIEAGVRHEQQEHSPINDPRNRPAFDSSAFSWSGALIWTLTEEYTLSATFAEAQRLPHAQELYARGIHLATNTYECGLVPHPLTCGGAANNQALARETSQNIDLALNKHSGALTYSINLYRNQVDDYIYARTLDQFEDFRLIKYTQKDATFTGLEAQVDYAFSETFSAGVFGDYVRADFDDGSGNLPRISPRRIGARANLLVAGMDAELELFHVERQNRIAAYETATPGYNMLNATLSYSPQNAQYSLFVRASNLLDDEVWSHSSFLANVIPMQGRNLSAGLRYNF